MPSQKGRLHWGGMALIANGLCGGRFFAGNDFSGFARARTVILSCRGNFEGKGENQKFIMIKTVGTKTNKKGNPLFECNEISIRPERYIKTRKGGDPAKIVYFGLF